jgi:adenylate kinase family enzyme
MKLHIFGASGTGVTTLGRALSLKLKIPYFDSDAYFWEHSDPPFTVRRDPLKRNELIRADLEKQDNLILGGSVIDWGDHLLPQFNLIVFLWLSPEIRLDRLTAREFALYGDQLTADPNRRKQFQEFLAWAADYDNCTGLANRTIIAHEQWLKKQTCSVLEIRENTTTEERMEIVISNLAEESTWKF